MRKKLTTEEFIKRAREVHGDEYSYTKTVYIDIYTPVIITCPIHGDFEQIPHTHLCGGGCKKCGLTKNKSNAKYGNRKKVYGVGINNYVYTPENKDKNYLKSLGIWSKMIERCYSDRWLKKRPTYSGCSVCDDWIMYSNFRKWFNDSTNGYRDGYHLDKDILVKGNKVYSPQTCCFVPSSLNSMLTNRKRFRGNLPIGVSRRENGKFFAEISIRGKSKKLGDFFLIEEAFFAYKKAKESHIKEVAQKYHDEGKITERVYNALMKYEVEITD